MFTSTFLSPKNITTWQSKIKWIKTQKFPHALTPLPINYVLITEPGFLSFELRNQFFSADGFPSKVSPN